ncbi:MAG: hypothetical protein LUQ30_00390 [Methanothrix sp.]|nr:hypothetical protein [Methanothrix sp.]
MLSTKHLARIKKLFKVKIQEIVWIGISMLTISKGNAIVIAALIAAIATVCTNTDLCTCNCDPPYSIIITEPKEGDLINISTNVTGEFSGKLPGDRYMWVAVRNAARTTALCWPQEGRIDPIEGYPWTVPCRFGGENDSGAEYYVAAILMDKSGSPKMRGLYNSWARHKQLDTNSTFRQCKYGGYC